jgi:nitrous oxidase accessory protein
MKKAALALTLILTLFVSLAIEVQSAKSTSKTITVPDDYLTIESAINNANEGDTIFVKKGVYVENPVVNKSISLVGENRDSTVIDVTAGLKVQSNNVTITGFTIYDGYDGISLAANYCNISGNKITNTTHGIVVFGYENSISGNIFESIGLSSAIQLNFANRNLVNNNFIDSCVEGIQIWQNSNNNTIRENTITNCQDTAINFQYSNDNVIVGNNISLSGLGTHIYGSNNNIISNNNYFNNTLQFSANEDYYLTFGGNRSVNTINENYWSDYDGTDADSDGIGDAPYIIDAYNADHYPLIKPVAVPELPDGADNNGSDKTEPFPTLTVLAVSVTVVAVVAISLLVYFKKRKRQSE